MTRIEVIQDRTGVRERCTREGSPETEDTTEECFWPLEPVSDYGDPGSAFLVKAGGLPRNLICFAYRDIVWEADVLTSAGKRLPIDKACGYSRWPNRRRLPTYYDVVHTEGTEGSWSAIPELEPLASCLMGLEVSSVGALPSVQQGYVLYAFPCFAPDKLEWEGRRFLLHEKLDYPVMLEDGLWVVECQLLGIRAYAASYDQALREFSEEFAFLWDEYAQVDDSTLTADAVALKQRMLAIVRGVIIE